MGGMVCTADDKTPGQAYRELYDKMKKEKSGPTGRGKESLTDMMGETLGPALKTASDPLNQQGVPNTGGANGVAPNHPSQPIVDPSSIPKELEFDKSTDHLLAPASSSPFPVFSSQPSPPIQEIQF